MKQSPTEKLNQLLELAEKTAKEMTELKENTFNQILDAYEKNEPTFWTSVLSILKSYTIQEEEMTEKIHAAALEIKES